MPSIGPMELIVVLAIALIALGLKPRPEARQASAAGSSRVQGRADAGRARRARGRRGRRPARPAA